LGVKRSVAGTGITEVKEWLLRGKWRKGVLRWCTRWLWEESDGVEENAQQDAIRPVLVVVVGVGEDIIEARAWVRLFADGDRISRLQGGRCSAWRGFEGPNGRGRE
jgi:hypothetical protein